MANKAQKFLLDKNCSDLILNEHRITKPEDRIYASDIMMLFLESEQEQNDETRETQLAIPAVSNLLCGSFDPDTRSSSATKCKYGRERWEHPKAT